MKKKKALRILAVASAAALLSGGIYLLTKDDIKQKIKDNDLKPYMPTPVVLASLDDISDSDNTTVVTENISEDSVQVTESAVTASPELSSEIRQQLIESTISLNKAYPNAIGWLYIPNTAISYPIMQADDNSYYLEHTYDGSSLKAGSIFLDFRCENRFMNPVNIIYGHNMNNGSMLAGVLNYADNSYFDSHKYGWLATTETVYRIDFFSCAKADWNDDLYKGSTPTSEWIPHILYKSVISREIAYTEIDRFISLSTCSYEFQNARTILTGKLNETKEV